MRVALAVALAIGACAEPADRCEALAERLTECDIDAGRGDLLAACETSSEAELDTLLGASCDELFGATASFGDEGKADDGTGGLCLFSSQCGAGLVCRPDMHFINRCMPPGTLGQHCWSDAHCTSGMTCHWIWHEIEPFPHPGRVCNPHQAAEHLHQSHDELPDHAHGSPGILDPTRSYRDRATLLLLLRDRHPYPFHGTGDAWFDHRDGLLVQTMWQDESGRDAYRPDGRLWSWWTNINWTLTVWQAEVLRTYRGELGDVTIVGYSDSRFAIPQDVVTAVLELYDTIDAIRRSAERGELDASERAAAEWRLQQLMWRLHEVVLEVALERNRDLLQALPPGEREFAASWETTVKLLTAAYFPTNFTTIRRIQRASLPHRLVVSDDLVITRPSDLSATARATLLGLRALDRVERSSFGSVSKLARLFSSTRERAQSLSRFIEETMVTGGNAMPDRLLAWMRAR